MAVSTMSDALQRILADISRMKTFPDADLQFCAQLETMILQKLREPIDAVKAMGLTSAGGGPQPGMPPGMPPGGGGPPGAGGPPGMPPGMQLPPGMPPPGAGGIPQGVPGVMQGPQMPNPDELRRILGGKH